MDAACLKPDGRVMGIALAFGVGLWLFDALLDYLVFYPGNFLDLLLFQVPIHEIYIRVLILLCFLAFGFLASCFLQVQRRSAERLAHQAVLLERVSDAVITTDLSEDQIVLSWNGGAEETYGWKKEEALGEALHQLLRTEIPETSIPDEQGGFLVNGSWEGEVRQRHKDGRTLHVWNRAVLLRDLKGNPLSALGVNRDITKRKEAEAALEESRIGLRALTGRLAAEWEEERLALSRELHDYFGHELIGHLFDLRELNKRLSSDDREVTATLDQMVRTADRLIHRARKLSGSLRSPLLELLGLQAALAGEIEEFERSCSIVIHSELEEVSLEGQEQLTLFRVFQDVLNRARQDDDTGEMWVNLREEGGTVCLKVVRDGNAPKSQVEEARWSAATLAMRERARAVGGELEVTSDNEDRTILTLTFPLPEELPLPFDEESAGLSAGPRD